ncbi:hypothetical protein HMSSN036_28620 [Paenibacillus macerans]|nr:hypothetical protein HMSSN036_28620 [Paenibacillus macerans]
MAVDLSAKLIDGAKVEIITGDSKEGQEIMRHSTAHLMAQAVKRLFGSKEVKLGVGPVIEDGFYYDMDLEHPLNPEDLQKIEKEMERIIGEICRFPGAKSAAKKRWRFTPNWAIRTSWSLFAICRKTASSRSMIKASFSTCAGGRTCLRRAKSKCSSC